MEKRILIIGATGGIGKAMCKVAQGAGFQVSTLSRTLDRLDITDEASIAHHLGAQSGKFDMIFVATGALEIGTDGPEKSLRQLSGPNMTAQFTLNTIGPALILKHAMALLHRDRSAVFVALSARVGSIDDNKLGGWVSYRAAKAALNQVIRTGAIELARTHPQAACIALHPGTVETKLTQKFTARHAAQTADQAAERLWSVITALTPADTGGFYDHMGKKVPW